MYKIRAPELEPYVAWINTTQPLSIRDLRGQLVLLDFWTYCCVNCMHVIPVLRDLERRHRDDPLVVIGVHSAKFDTESRPERVEEAVARYGVEHPVVVDRDMGIWERYAVRSWPTLVAVRPDGTVAAVAPGEPDPDLLEQFVQEQLEEARRAGTLAPAPFRATRMDLRPRGVLAFPGKVAIAPDGRIAVSDSGHHRVLVTAPDGRVQECIGSGLRGRVDGAFSACAFDDPQGVAWDGEALWIADSRNHAVRRADLASGTVRTVAGNGRMGVGLVHGRVPGASAELRSPWDVLPLGDAVYVAMAGAHQIWSVDKGTGECGPFAGSGREALVDGAAREAAFAQPSGLCLAGEVLYVADSETSSVRALRLPGGEVSTLVGAGLFDFGDADGPAREARLQHALGVAAAADGALVVADTYNDRLRRLDLQSERLGTFYRAEGERALREPGGLAADPSGGFVVADTNNHRLVRVSDAGEWLGEVSVTGAPLPREGDAEAAGETPGARGRAGSAVNWFTADLEPDAGRAFGEGDVLLSLTLAPADGWKLAPQSDVRVSLEVSRRSDLLEFDQTSLVQPAADGRVVLTARGHVARLPGAGVPSEVLLAVDALLCSERDGVCVPARACFRLPVRLRRGGDRALGYNLPVAPPSL